MRQLGNPNSDFAGDRGEADPEVRRLLAGCAGPDAATYPRAVAALCGARLLLPIAPDPDGDLAALQVRAADGRTALPVFTGLDSLQAWQTGARPVPCTLDDVAATAVETGSVAIVVDLAGPASVVIEDPLIAELAAGRRLVELAEGGFGWLSVGGPEPDPADAG